MEREAGVTHNRSALTAHPESTNLSWPTRVVESVGHQVLLPGFEAQFLHS